MHAIIPEGGHVSAGEGWSVGSAGCHLRVPWSRTRKLGETDDQFFLMIDTCAGYTLPKRHFESETDQGEFRDFVAGRLG